MAFLEYNGTNVSFSEGNASVDDAYYSLIKQPVYMVVVLGLAYGIIFVLALLGNICVMVIIYKDKRFHTATYVFLVNLAISDLLVAFCCLPVTLMTNLYNENSCLGKCFGAPYKLMRLSWRFGAFMCKAVPYLQGISVCASVNTLAAIAIDRFIAICFVLRLKMTMRIARMIIVVIWCVALTIMIPWALYYNQVEYRTSIQVLYVCYQTWPTTGQDRDFFVAVFLLCYAIPLVFIVLCYVMIGLRVWNRDAPGITTERGVILKSKIRVVKMLVVVVLLFALSWLPLYAVQIKLYFFRPDDTSDEMGILQNSIMPLAQWLGTSNTCMNPLVYCLFSKRIRGRIRLMLICASSSESQQLVFSRYYSSTRHMTVDYSNGHVKLAFKRPNLTVENISLYQRNSDTISTNDTPVDNPPDIGS
ncbi:neuropeptide SIFamide receptor-like [Gigantopelta aegis]|uniref:neuropeptide SIFamide receptor-like n=1 Tax=Gigantopelta aegis TaxID=1735272 RepID=UPI001B8897EB|nr:neuropeptide SIFamide receptor-like [Gigantopelta aegis]